MPAGKMHADEYDIDAGLVRRLIARQFPRWADLPVEPVPSAGTDHALFRLGAEMVVRLPRIERVIDQVTKEGQWLPRLAPHLPLRIPQPVVAGVPDADYPWPWAIYRWLDGVNLSAAADIDPIALARGLAQFIAALHHIDTAGGPEPGAHNFYRGVPLAIRDAETRAAIAALDGLIDADAARSAWEVALSAPAWAAPPVWIHGDLQAGNLLVQDGRLSAVIDFGGLALGDPACDLQVAWNLLAGEARATLRAALAVDAATWARGRGWALSVALIALPYYRQTNPPLADIARRTIAAVLSDQD